MEGERTEGAIGRETTEKHGAPRSRETNAVVACVLLDQLPQ